MRWLGALAGLLLALPAAWGGNHTFALAGNRFIKDGQPIRILSGR